MSEINLVIIWLIFFAGGLIGYYIGLIIGEKCK